MAANKPAVRKKFFTVAQANAALPLVRAIVQDIAVLAADLRDRQERVKRVRGNDRIKIGEPHEEELRSIEQEFDRGYEQMLAYQQELQDLGVELKDPFTGLIDFPCLLHGREVYLCWRLGEPSVGHWHELDAGFSGRQKLPRSESSSNCN